MKRAACIALMLAAGTACSSASGDLADSGRGTSDTNNVGDDTGTDDTSQPDPERFRVLGSVTVSEGQYSDAELRYVLLAADGTEICSETHGVETLSLALSPEPEWVFDWVLLELADAETSCQVSLPSSLGLGLGKLFPEVVPYLEANGVDQVEGSLQGFYASFPEPWSDGVDQSVLAMGYAGTEAALAGEIPAAESAPLPDGVYSFQSVFTLTLE